MSEQQANEAAEQAGAFVTHSRLDNEGRIARTLAAGGAGKTGGAKTPFAKMAFHEQFGEISTPVLLFGAGHVGRAVVLALAPLPFAVHWIDGRPDQFPQHVPGNVVTLRSEHPAQEFARAPGDAFVLVMTHSHPLDFDITAAALQRETFEFVGLIGSDTKRARFTSFARQVGVTARQLDRLVCPTASPRSKARNRR